MLVFWDEKLVFLATPKTGTTAIEGALSPRADIILRGPPQLKHSPVYRYRRFLKPLFAQGGGEENMETVALVRNPIDWLGSWYRYRHRDEIKGQANSTQGISFDDFISEYCKGKPSPFANIGSQSNFLTLGDKSIGVDYLYQYEALPKLLAFFEDRLGNKITLNRKNVSPAMTLTLSSDIEARLREKHAFEFEVWNQGIA